MLFYPGFICNEREKVKIQKVIDMISEEIPKYNEMMMNNFKKLIITCFSINVKLHNCENTLSYRVDPLDSIMNYIDGEMIKKDILKTHIPVFIKINKNYEGVLMVPYCDIEVMKFIRKKIFDM